MKNIDYFSNLSLLFPNDTKFNILVAFSALPPYSKYVIRKLCGENLFDSSISGNKLTNNEIEHLNRYVIPNMSFDLFRMKKYSLNSSFENTPKFVEINDNRNHYKNLLIELFGLENLDRANRIVVKLTSELKKEKTRETMIKYIYENVDKIREKLDLCQLTDIPEHGKLSEQELEFDKICSSKLFRDYKKEYIIRTIKLTMALKGIPFSNRLSELLNFFKNNLSAVLQNLRRQIFISYGFISDSVVDDEINFDKIVRDAYNLIKSDPEIAEEDIYKFLLLYLDCDEEKVSNSEVLNVERGNNNELYRK